jgi:VWFA-related protein
MKTRIGAWLMGVGCAFALRAAPPATEVAQSEATFKVTAALVQLDAVVTDSKGRPVTDLGPADFEISEDGKPQKLTHFSFVGVGPGETAAAARAAGQAASALPEAPMAPGVAHGGHRTVILVVDDMGISFVDMAFVRNSLRKFVNTQVQPGDRVSICRASGGAAFAEQFSSDKKALLAKVEDIRWRTVGGEGGVHDLREHPSTSATILSLNYLIGALSEVPGRKSIVLFSEGFLSEVGDPEMREAMRRMMDRAYRSSTVLYTLQAGGLVAEYRVQPGGLDGKGARGPVPTPSGPGLSGDGPSTTGDASMSGWGQSTGSDIEMQQNMALVAEQTGGFAYFNGNDLNWALDRVLEDQASYYLLGYRPPEGDLQDAKGEPRFHHVSVRVTRPGLRVRTRNGFYDGTDEQALSRFATPAERLRAKMLSPFKYSDIDLHLTALYAESRGHGALVRNLLVIKGGDLTWKQDSRGRENSRVVLVANATSTDGQPLAVVNEDYKVSVMPEKVSRTKREGLLYVLDVPVPERGPYQMRVAVEDPANGAIGSATAFLQVPDPEKTWFTLTSVVLNDTEHTGKDETALDLESALRRFKHGSAIEFLSGIEKPGKSAPDPEIEARVRLLHDGKEFYSAPAQVMAMKDGRRVVAGGLKINETMPAGDYNLQISAKPRSGGAGTLVEQWAEFTVLPDSPSK